MQIITLVGLINMLAKKLNQEKNLSERITNQPQKDQSGNTISSVESSPQYRNNGGGAGLPFP